MEMVVTERGDKPRQPVMVESCGQIGEVAAKADEQDDGEQEEQTTRAAAAASKSSGAQSKTADDEDNQEGKRQAQDEEEEEEEPEQLQVTDAQLDHMSEGERRLFNLRLKLNKDRKENKHEVAKKNNQN